MSNAPSESYQQHHDVVAPRVDARAFRQGWKVATRLDGLHVEGVIDGATYEAGVRFRRDWEHGFHERSTWLASSGRGGKGSSQGTIDRLAALGRLRRIAAKLAPLDYKLLEQCAVLDLPWAAIGRSQHVAETTAKRWTVAALCRLAKLAP